MRQTKILLVLLALWLTPTGVAAQITPTYTFGPSTTVSVARLNTNFTNLGTAALNRAGGTLTGNLTVSGSVTIDGADISTYLSGGRVFATTTGTVSLPAISFAADTNSGIYSLGADNIGVAVNGTKILDIGTGGLTLIGSLGVTGTRVTVGWFTDLAVTNTIAGSVSGTALGVTGSAQPNIVSAVNLTRVGALATGSIASTFGAIASTTSVALTGTTNNVGTITTGVWNAGAVTSSAVLTSALSTPGVVLKRTDSASAGHRINFTNNADTVLWQIGANQLVGTGLEINAEGVNKAYFTATTAELKSILTVSGFGAHAFAAGGTGTNSLAVRNNTDGTGNYSVLYLGNNTSSSAAALAMFASGFTDSAPNYGDGLAISCFYDGGISIAAQHDSGVIRFFTGATGGTKERMRVAETGYVGIGTVAPTTYLEVYSTAASNAAGQSVLQLSSAVVYATVGSGPKIVFHDGPNNADIAYIRAAAEAAEIGLQFGTGYSTPSTKMTITGAGNVGIGRVTPSARLQIKGAGTSSSTYPLNTIDSSDGDTFYIKDDGAGYLKAAAWTYGSDRRMKENITTILPSDAVARLAGLVPKYFDYINEGPKQQIGYIAQDVQVVIPEAVSVVNEKTGFLGLKSEFVTPLLVVGWQAHDARIAALEARIAELEKR